MCESKWDDSGQIIIFTNLDFAEIRGPISLPKSYWGEVVSIRYNLTRLLHLIHILGLGLCVKKKRFIVVSPPTVDGRHPAGIYQIL